MSTAHRWYVTALLTALAILNYADRAVISAVLPLIRHDLGLSDIMLGAMSSAFLWTYALASPASGYLADRLPRVRVITWSLILWSLATMLAGVVANAQQLILARMLLGLSQCAFLPAVVALTADFQPPARRALAIVIPLAGANLGFVVGSVLAGYSGDHFGWRPVFYFLGAVGLGLAVVCKLSLRRLATGRAPAAAGKKLSPLRDLRAILTVPSYVMVLLESSSIAFGSWVLLFWLSFFFSERYHLSLTSAAFAGTLALQLAATTGYLAGGAVSNRFAGARRERRMLFQSICYFIAAPFLLIFAFDVSLPVLSACILGFSLFRGLGSCTDQVIVCEVLPSNLRATALGLQNSVNTGAGALGVFLAGYLLKHFSLAHMFACISLPIALGATLNYIGYKRFLRHDLIEEPQAG
ncbi:MAG: major facilitator superfamily 1 [Verrucomicrobia bacterium]|nr:major facilitator superfamily 1 [Verrucomicrobiota bacterium]